MQAIITLILANLPTIISAGQAGYKFVMDVRAAAKQANEWTEAQEAEFQAKLAAESIDPAWLPDAALETAAAVTAPAPAAAPVLTLPADPTPIKAPETVASSDAKTDVADPNAGTGAAGSKTPEVAQAAAPVNPHPVCSKCGCTLIPNGPDNCSC